MIATAALAAQYAGTLELLDTSRVDAVAAQPAPQIPSPPREIAIAANASTTPAVRLRLQGRRSDWSFSYSPTLAVTDIELVSQAQPVIVNTGAIGFGWHHRLVQLRIDETASYGVQNLLYAYTAPLQGGGVLGGPIQAPVMPVAPGGTPAQPTMPGQAGQPASTNPLQQFPYGSSVTAATVSWRALRRFSTFVVGGYRVSGNFDSSSATAATVLPLQYGPFGTLVGDYGVSRTDSLLTRLSGQDTTTPMGVCNPPTVKTCRLDAPVFSLQELARRRISATGFVSIGAGASAALTQFNTGTNAWVVLPTAEVRYVDRIEGAGASLAPLDTSTLTLLAQLAPTVDINTGQVNNMVQGTAMAVRRVAHDVFLTVVANVIQSVPPDAFPITGVSGSANARWRVDRQIDLLLGIQGFWQNQQFSGVAGGVGIPTTTTAEVAFLSMVARLPALRF